MVMSLLAGGFVLLPPLIGGLIAGLDRIITARMQSRVGPPLLQPFYDLIKLFSKQNIASNRFHRHYLMCYIIFMIFSGAMFFSGRDLLLVIFAYTLADIFLVMAAFSATSPYSFIGAQRELIQLIAAEPILLITALGMNMACGSFNTAEMFKCKEVLFLDLPGVFFALVFVLTFKLRKSPFDLSTSHHGHQELVKGLTTEFAGRTLGIFELAHFYETVLLLGIIYLFFAPYWWLALLVIALTYFAELVIDNTYARAKIKLSLLWTWALTIAIGGGNLVVLYILGHVRN